MKQMLKVGGVGRNINGWIPDRPDHRDLLMTLPSAQIASSTDLRSLCSEVENQGFLGSCTANATTSAMEFLYKKDSKTINLSRLFCYYSTRVWISGDDPKQDGGARIRDCIKSLSRFGVCTEDMWPYLSTRFSKAPSLTAKIEATSFQILNYAKITSLSGMKACLLSGLPFVGGFSVPESINLSHAYRTGEIPYPTISDRIIGGHAVLFVGFDDKKRMLTFKNSWGVEWGDGGYGYLPYDYIENNLASDFWVIQGIETGELRI